MVILLVITVALRPWEEGLLNILEIVIQVLILIVVIILLVIAAYDHNGCFVCADREGWLCWIVVLLLFFALLLGCLGALYYLYNNLGK